MSFWQVVELITATVKNDEAMTSKAVLAATANGQNALHKACGGGHGDVVDHILKHYPSLVNGSSESGTTPLHYACLHGSGPITRALLEAGADVNATTLAGQSALHKVDVSN